MHDPMRRDFHVHTTHSGCGKPDATVEGILQVAEERGLEAIGFTDHLWIGSDPAMFDDVRARVRSYGSTSLTVNGPALEVYVGCEAQQEDFDRLTIDAALAGRLDFVMVAANHFHLAQVADAPRETLESWAHHVLAMTETTIESGLADIIAHPFYLRGTGQPLPETIEAMDPSDLSRCLEKAAAHGVAMEINPGHAVIWPEAMAFLLARYREYGLKVSLGSDAHRLADVGHASRHEAKAAAIAALGLHPDDRWIPRRR